MNGTELLIAAFTAFCLSGIIITVYGFRKDKAAARMVGVMILLVCLVCFFLIGLFTVAYRQVSN